MKTAPRFPHAVTETPHLWITLSDGTAGWDALSYPYLAGHGYACLRVDMRGNGDSAGLMADEYTVQEQADAVEVIDWITRQPWSSGAVGVMGISRGSFNSLQVAALAPPALKAIITLCFTADRYADDTHYEGGCMQGENPGGAGTMRSFCSRPPDPAIPGDWLETEPFRALPCVQRQRTGTRSAMWSDSERFYLSGRLEACETDRPICARDVEESVPRDHL